MPPIVLMYSYHKNVNINERVFINISYIENSVLENLFDIFQ